MCVFVCVCVCVCERERERASNEEHKDQDPRNKHQTRVTNDNLGLIRNRCNEPKTKNLPCRVTSHEQHDADRVWW